MMRRIVLGIIFMTVTALPAAAQLGRRISVQAGTPEDQALTAITQATSPQQKLALLDKFAAKHPTGDMALMADRLYVSVYSSLKNYPKVYEYGQKALAIDPNNLEVGVELVRAAQLQNDIGKMFTYGAEVGKMVQRYKAEPPPANFPADEWTAQKQQALASAEPDIHWVAGTLYQVAVSQRLASRRAEYLNRFMDAFPNSSYTQSVELRVAQAYHRAGESEKMLAFVQKRVAANPADIGMQLMLADYLSSNGLHLDQAEASAKKVISLVPTATKPSGMTDAAWKKQSDNRQGLAYSALGQVYVEQKNYVAAVKSFEQAKPLLVGSKLNNARNLYRLGSTLARLRRYAEARAALEEAAKLDTPYRASAENLLRRLPGSRRRRR